MDKQIEDMFYAIQKRIERIEKLYDTPINVNTQEILTNDVAICDVAELSDTNSIAIDDLAIIVDDLNNRVSALEG